jgi:hypothetical protein
MYSHFIRLFILIFALVTSQLSFAQLIGKSYSFNEIGWTFTLPATFTTIDSSENAKKMDRGLKAIEDVNDIKADVSQTKTLISAMKNSFSYFSATIIPFDPATDGDYAKTNKPLRDILYKTLYEKIPNAKLDSSGSNIKIDGLSFDKFIITVQFDEKRYFTMVLLSKLYKGYDFGISYLYTDEETKKEIESLLASSKFN